MSVHEVVDVEKALQLRRLFSRDILEDQKLEGRRWELSVFQF